MSPAAEDLRHQRAVLARLLALPAPHPTIVELDAEICGDGGGFADGDALARAVGDLRAAGLLQVNGAVVMPTRAALHFDSLGL